MYLPSAKTRLENIWMVNANWNEQDISSRDRKILLLRRARLGNFIALFCA